MKGLLFPNQKRLGPFPKKAHTLSENDTSPSASSHIDASHSSRELNLPDSEHTHLPPFKGLHLPRKLSHYIGSVDRQAPRVAYVVLNRWHLHSTGVRMAGRLDIHEGGKDLGKKDAWTWMDFSAGVKHLDMWYLKTALERVVFTFTRTGVGCLYFE